jgi:hypothetical protein
MHGTLSQSSRITSELEAEHVAKMWMTACVDENPGVLYLSVDERLNIDEKRAKAIVKEWRELFRPGINPRDEHERLPALRRHTVELLDKAKHERKITEDEYNGRKKDAENPSSNLENECFRSQLRRELRSDRSSPDGIKLGLDFIENFRRSYLDFAAKTRDERQSRMQFWSILGTLLLGLIALFANVYVGMEANRLKKQDLALKQQELLLKQREVERLPLPTPAPSSPAH